LIELAKTETLAAIAKLNSQEGGETWPHDKTSQSSVQSGKLDIGLKPKQINLARQSRNAEIRNPGTK
jgi:hypothetical protein